MTELIWDGKYKDGKKQGPVRIALPFQTIETVNESVQERQRSLEFFSAGREAEWRNRLIWGDKKYVLPSLLPEFGGRVHLIYIDPPFDTGADFSFTATVPPDSEGHLEDSSTFIKEPSIIEQKAYRDTWGRGLDSYLLWFYESAVLLHELLDESGTIYVHLDWHVSHYAKGILDEVFGREQFRNEIVWKRTSAHANVGQRFAMVNDRIFVYTRGESWTWNQPYTPYTSDYIDSHYGQVEASSGRRFTTRDLTASMERASSGQLYAWKGLRPPSSRCWAYTKEKMEKFEAENRLVYSERGMPRLKLYLDDMPGTPADDLWTDIYPINSQAEERVGYATQKPESLLERITKASSREGDLVLDPFIGSGTTAAVAERLNRRWIGCDLSRFAIHTTRKRLLGIAGVKPFTVQNLGKYERQAWQVAEFPANGKNHFEEQCEREAAYRRFILDLYRAQPISGYAWLHGIRNGRMVHVGAVDAPVTAADVKAIAKEAWKAVGTGKDAPTKAAADILGWEFAFEVNEPAKQIAAESRVDVAFKKIPREVLDKKAVEQGDVRFFELGALSVDVKQKRDSSAREAGLRMTEGKRDSSAAKTGPQNDNASDTGLRMTEQRRDSSAQETGPQNDNASETGLRMTEGKRDSSAPKTGPQNDSAGERGLGKTGGCEVTLRLTDFLIPTDDIPEEARKAIKHWSQLIDYWAVDWDYKKDTFHNQWQAYRTRKDPKIELEAKYKYAEAGKYQIVVKVIDILGNDTTKTLEVSVK